MTRNFSTPSSVNPEGERADTTPSTPEWTQPNEEGQLAVDVFEIKNDVVVVAAMAGTKPEHISIHLQDDLLTIRGTRDFPLSGISSTFYRECFWGAFSRTIVLPVEVREESARAEYKNGVLVVRLEKARREARIPLVVVEE